MTSKPTKELTQKELSELRNKLYNGTCPICGRTTELKEMSLDHIHGSHKSIYPETNKLCRDLICSDCNVLIGKIENQFLRSSKKFKENSNLSNILRNIADYIEKYSSIENFEEYFIHPTEWKPKKLKKSWFNKLNKLYKERIKNSNLKKKELKYPSSGKLTKEIEKWSKEFNLEPEYY
jgi:hypothetical protein